MMSQAERQLKRLLIVYHSMSGGTQQLAEAAALAASGEVTVCVRHAAEATLEDVLAADAFLFASPEYLAAMAGAMKDFFDRCYYGALGRIEGRPYAVIVCAGSDGNNAVRQIQRIATGWRLREVAPALIVNVGAQTPEAIAAPKKIAPVQLQHAAELGAGLAAGVALGIY